MNRRELTALLASLDIQPSRKLGQNFLVDGNTLRLIVEAGRPEPGKRVLEIGPGTGVLTRSLLDRGAVVTAVEYDARLAEYLRGALGDEPNFTLHQADACRADLAAILGPEPYSCIANLPYAVSTVVLGRLLELDNRPQRLTILLQREMAERLAAEPGNKTYGSLTVRTQAIYRVKIVRIVPPTVFFPPPEVDSALVTLDLQPDAPDPAGYARLEKVVRQAFSQRRKQLQKLLRPLFPGELLASVLADLGIAPAERPEQLTVATFVELSKRLP